jgi:hypothetical protein
MGCCRRWDCGTAYKKQKWKVERPDGRWLAFVVSHPSSKSRSMDGAPASHGAIFFRPVKIQAEELSRYNLSTE